VRDARDITAPRTERCGFEDPTRLESGGGGLVGSTHDYARFCPMMLNKGEIAGTRILKPDAVSLMPQNHIGALHVGIDETSPQPGAETVRFGLDFAVYVDPKSANLPFGNGTYYWGGAAGTWFWIDPVHDLAFVGDISKPRGKCAAG